MTLKTATWSRSQCETCLGLGTLTAVPLPPLQTFPPCWVLGNFLVLGKSVVIFGALAGREGGGTWEYKFHGIPMMPFSCQQKQGVFLMLKNKDKTCHLCAK